MPETMRVVCRSDELAEAGDGVRFEVDGESGPEAAFAVRYRGRVRAFLNRCAHARAELDWTEGKFFEAGGTHLICSIHGALYDPETGRCAGGPCAGRGLVPLDVVERDGLVVVRAQPAKDDGHG